MPYRHHDAGRGAPATLGRTKTMPPADPPRLSGERSDSDTSGWYMTIRFFVSGVWGLPQRRYCWRSPFEGCTDFVNGQR